MTLKYRRLDTGDKPLDFGGNGITGSINREGRITALNVYHPEHGYITLTSAPPFDESARYIPAAVRAYRKNLAAQEGYGLRFSESFTVEAGLIEDAIPQLKLTLASGTTAEVTIFVTHQQVRYLWKFSDARIAADFKGKVWVQRSAYTQLTEGGPIPMPSPETRIVSQTAEHVILENPSLPAVFTLSGVTGAAREDGSVELTSAFPVIENQVYTIGQELSETGDFSAEAERWQSCWMGWPYEHHPLDLLLRRALVYALHCCIPMDEQHVCVITDHQLLPLSWTRDAYYTVLPLLHWKFADTVKKHLRWLFEKAERPQGYWGRAYLTNGRMKDPAFQLDQQLYPLLELAEYTENTGHVLEHFHPQVEAVLKMLLERQDKKTGLFPTDETPADDPVHLPYHLSSHILLWRTLKKLNYDNLADSIQAAVFRYFSAEYEGSTLFAYLTDGSGQYHFYHDANDLPLAFAPLWGFCTADNPIWTATMNFAFSETNKGGFYGTADDEFRGLGS
ncbi:MAG: glycoside hydrolase family 125 protein, partial [Anaerolineae bacterium]|nr:glycoside hydrolase family 125 protein [Anaerolineae bacterium]